MKRIDAELMDELSEAARQSPRLRSHHNLHEELSDPVQRLLIAVQKGTYVRPHHHPVEGKWELQVALLGTLCLVIFDAEGTVLEKILLGPDNTIGVELPPNTWHTVYPVDDSAVFMEVKAGPYTPATASDFANWAPQEGDPQVAQALAWFEQCKVGQRFST